MAADLVKIRTKRFWGQRILGSEDFGGSSDFQVERKGGSVIANRVLDCLGYMRGRKSAVL